MTPAVLVLAGPVSRAELPRLSAELRALLRDSGTGTVVCDVAGLGPPGLVHVDLLARLQLAARRAGGRITLRAPGRALTALLALTGLVFETEGQPEQREPPLRVEEAVQPSDPPV
ncbi:MAG TPA: STAS domain-containing protein [Streptomyces sp.]|nr:STAS domain-containing protein [Streptomyces sp.]